MTCSATAALIHKRVSRLQALVRGRQTRQHVVGAMREEYASVCAALNREAFGEGQEEPPYSELADLGFLDGDEWSVHKGNSNSGGSGRPQDPPTHSLVPQLLPRRQPSLDKPQPQQLPQPQPQQLLAVGDMEAPASSTAATVGGDDGEASEQSVAAASSSIPPPMPSLSRGRSKEDVLAELASVRLAIQERVEVREGKANMGMMIDRSEGGIDIHSKQSIYTHRP